MFWLINSALRALDNRNYIVENRCLLKGQVYTISGYFNKKYL